MSFVSLLLVRVVLAVLVLVSRPQGKFALPYQFLRSAVEGTLQEQLVTLEAKVEELSVAGLQAAETNQRLRSEDPLVIKGLKQLEQHDRRSLEETIREYVDIIRQQQSLIRYAVSSTVLSTVPFPPARTVCLYSSPLLHAVIDSRSEQNISLVFSPTSPVALPCPPLSNAFTRPSLAFQLQRWTL